MIWVVLPAYNESLNIGALLDAIDEALRETGRGFEVIVVNDGSTDGTARIVRGRSMDSPVRLVDHPQNLGLAAAVKTGLLEAMREAAEDDLVVVMDADNTHDTDLILVMQRKVEEGADLIIASRYHPGARVVGLSPWRRLLSWGASFLFRIFHPMSGVRDYTSGFRLYRASLLRRAMETYEERLINRSAGFSVTLDLLLKLKRFNPVIAEVPMVLRYDRKQGASKMRIARNIRAILPLILKRYR